MTENTLAWRESLDAARTEARGPASERTGGVGVARAGPSSQEEDGGRLLFVELFDPG